ncbi:WD40 repeat domain-containing protein [Gemmata massiliana]|uniref:WD40 repeat domain-containing protein n=1 Tax=Gemmata massiliana TaxID=1210884 RepID=UPI0021BC807C|nr:hypothetical protein [Gemmata massiliana]
MNWTHWLDECPPEYRHLEWAFLNALRRPHYTLNLKHGGQVYAMAYSPDGRYIASAGDGAVKLWDARTGEPVPCTVDHGDLVTCLAFHPTEPLLVMAGS